MQAIRLQTIRMQKTGSYSMKAALVTMLAVGIASAVHAQVPSSSQNPTITTPPGINPSVPMTTSPVPAGPGAAMTSPGNSTTTSGTSATGMGASGMTTNPTGGNGSSNNAAVGNPASSSATSTSGLQGGANSFTEGQARSRLDGAGYANVTSLAKDKDGVWRGRAMRAGSPVEVAVDYKGNVVAR